MQNNSAQSQSTHWTSNLPPPFPSCQPTMAEANKGLMVCPQNYTLDTQILGCLAYFYLRRSPLRRKKVAYDLCRVGEGGEHEIHLFTSIYMQENMVYLGVLINKRNPENLQAYGMSLP